MSIISKTVLKGFRRIGGKSSLLIKKAAPDICIFGGIAVIGGGMVFVAKGAVKTEDIIEERDEKLAKVKEEAAPEEVGKEQFKVHVDCAWKVFKAYAPAIILVTTGTTMIIAGRGMMKKRYAAVSGLYAAVNETLENYRERVRNEVGTEKEQEIYDNVIKEVKYEDNGKGKTKKTEVKTPQGSGHPFEFIFDECNMKYKKYEGNNWFVLSQAKKQATNILISKGYISLSEVLEILGMPVPSYAIIAGWTYNPNKPMIWGFEADDTLRHATNQSVLLKFNCEASILDQIDIISFEKYGYKCDFT